MAKIDTGRDDQFRGYGSSRDNRSFRAQPESEWVHESDKTPGKLSPRKLLMLLCCAGAPFLIMLDSNIVAVSLPSIARDLHGKFTDVEWVVSAYILPFAALLIPAGALADRLGRRRLLLLGLSIFTFSSLLCGLANGLNVLNGARAVQAVGAALQLSAALAVITHGFKANERAGVYAILGTVMGVAPSLGPVVGGLVTSYLGWRWAFFINVPIGGILILLIMSSVDESKDPNASRLDLPGIFLFGTGLFNIVWALIAGNSAGWGSASTLSKLSVGAIILALFVFAERTHPRPMVDLSIFQDRTVVGAAIAMLGYAASAQVMMTLLPLYLQDTFSYSPAIAGLSMIPFALPLLTCPSIGGKLASRVSSRAILSFGLVLVAIGDAFTAAIILAGCSYWAAAIGMVIAGSGAGLLNGETTKAQISALSPDRAGMASGIAGATRFVGITIGLAGLGAVLAGVAEHNLSRIGISRVTGRAIDWHGLSLRIVGGDAIGALAGLPTDIREVIEQALRISVAHGFSSALAVGALIAAVSSTISWLLVRDPDSDNS